MLIKDILQDLIDDGLVNCEKCGTTNLYWSFKFDKVKKIWINVYRLETIKQEKIATKIQLIKSMESIDNDRQETSEFGQREQILTNLGNLKLHKHKLVELSNKLMNNDLINTESIKYVFDLQNHNEFFADSMEDLMYYFTKIRGTGISESDLRKEFNIPPELPLIYPHS